MSTAELAADGDRRWAIRGRMDFDSVPGLWQRLAEELRGGEIVLDLSGVKSANSAALALLLEAHQRLQRGQGRLRLEAVPENLLQLAALCGLSPLLDELRA